MSRKPDGADWRTARTVRVRAELDGPVRLHRDWPVPLDGLLASPRVIPRRVNEHGLLSTPSLPIVAAHRVSNWWWWASCAAPDPEPSWWADRWDRDRPGGSSVVVPAGTALEWWVVGEVGRLRELLGRVPELGLGDVRAGAAWAVADEGDPDYGLVLLTDDDTPGRPFPCRYAAELGWPADSDTIPGASRPPYHPPGPAATGDVAARHKAPVIAPWAVIGEVPDEVCGAPRQTPERGRR